MKVRILGCGSSGGVPALAFGWGKCDPNNPKNRRLRASILIEHKDTRLLVDTGPDLREQLLAADINTLTHVLYTHVHADHVMGIDDLRDINRVIKGPLPIIGAQDTLAELIERFSYIFNGQAHNGTEIYKPWLEPQIRLSQDATTINRIGDLALIAFDQDHGHSISTGFRCGPIAYSTDVTQLDECAFDVLNGVDVWIVDCLTDQPHYTHADFDKVMEWTARVQPNRLVLTHMGPALDYDETCARLQSVNPNWTCAYDGMEISA